MELYKSILIKLLDEGGVSAANIEKIIENRCYKALDEIIRIIRSQEFDDPECFLRIERIIEALEKIGVDGGFRHDFG